LNGGYDMPNYVNKFKGYDFPAYNQHHRKLSTDNNASPTEKEAFLYHFNRKFYSNLNIPNDDFKYSNKIKGISSKQYQNHEYSLNDANKQLSKNLKQLYSPNIAFSKKEKIRFRSKSVPNLQSKSLFQFPIKPARTRIPLKVHRTINGVIARKVLDPENSLSRQGETKLEIVRHFDQSSPKRPTILDLGSYLDMSKPSSPDLENHTYYNIPRVEKCDEPSDSNGHAHPYGNFSLPLPKRKSVGSPTQTSPLSNSRISDFGEIAISGGTLIEVPEGYCPPPKNPKVVNILRLKVPSD